MGIDPMNNISIIIRILFAVTIFQHQQPLSCPFTKKILFNSYFAHKRNPKNKTSPLFWATFGTFGQVVELEKGVLGLQRPMDFNQSLSSMIHGTLPPKHVECIQSPPNPSPRVT
jgi:hypothetical protein